MEERFPRLYDTIAETVRSRPAGVLDLDLRHLTHLYLEELDRLLPDRFEKASEYLWFTSYLLYLKSRLLLPREEGPPEEKVEEAPVGTFEGNDALGKVLLSREILGWDVFSAPPAAPPEPELEADLGGLVAAMARVLEREDPPTVEIRRLEPLFKKMTVWLREELMVRKRLILSELYRELADRSEKLALFLVLLDLSFREFCLLVQNAPWGEIEILLREKDL